MPHTTDPHPSRLSELAAFLFLTALTLAIFGPVVSHGFINYDDPIYVTKNPFVAMGLSSDGLWWAFTTVYDGNWFPLTWLSHMLDVTLYGFHPAGHHLTNLLLHLANTLLLFVVFKGATNRLWPSAVAAALFAVHPLHVEVVAWVAERKELLSTFFGLLATGAYIRYAKLPGTGRYLVVVVFLALSLAAKPMWMTFPLLMLVLDFWPLCRIHFSRPASKGDRVRSFARVLFEKIPFFGLSVASGLLALFTQLSGGGIQSFQTFPLTVRFANALMAYAGYLQQTIWPSGLSVYYPHPGLQIGFVKPALSAILLALITFWTIRRVGTRPYLLAGWAWYLISLLPVIGLVQLGTQAMSNRYTYVPLIGIFFAVTWWGKDLFHSRIRSPVAPAVFSAVLILALAGAARAQLGHWENSITLFEHARRTTRPNTVVLINLGQAYEAKGELARAESMYRQALDLNPTHPVALFNTARITERLGDAAGAVALYRRLLSLYPGNTDAANNLASVLAEKGRSLEALRWYRIALTAKPARPDTLANVAGLLSVMGRHREAIPYFERALALAPDDAVTHQNYAEVLAREEDVQEAIVQLTEAIRAGADREMVYCRMARLLAAEGNPAAEKFYQLAEQKFRSDCRTDSPKAAPERQDRK